MTTFEGLSENQRETIENQSQYLQIVAGPGTGKTLTLAHRIAHHIQTGTCPSRILALSFTNDACHALRAQLYQLLGERAENINIYTFHSFSHYILNQERLKLDSGSVEIADDWDSETIMKGLHPELTMNKLRTLPRHLLVKLKSFKIYQERLKAQGLTDYRNLLIHAQEIVGSYANDYDCIYIDEYQDTSSDQFKLIAELVKSNPHCSLTVVGDPNQEIYGFSDVEREFSPFAELKKLCDVSVCYLRINFRSTKPLVEFTNFQMPEKHELVAANNDVAATLPTLQILPSAYEKTRTAPIDKALVDLIDKVREKSKNTAVLAFTNKEVTNIVELFKKHDIPYETAFNKAMFKDKNPRIVYLLFRYVIQERNIQLLSILDASRGLLTPRIREKIEKLTNGFTLPILDTLNESLKPTTKLPLIIKFRSAMEAAVIELKLATRLNDVRRSVESVLKHIPQAYICSDCERLFEAMETQLPYFDPNLPFVPQFMQHNRSLATPDENTVQVRTIHSAKGLEWDTVVLPYLGSQDSLRFYQPPSNEISYRKILYVGMTRARTQLNILASGMTTIMSNPNVHVIQNRHTALQPASRLVYPKLFGPLVYRRSLCTLKRFI